MKIKLLLTISTALFSAPLIQAQTLIADYPLTVNNADVNGNLGPMTYSGTTTQAPNACSDGLSSSKIESPDLRTFISADNIQVSLTFKINGEPNKPHTPIFMLDQSYRPFSVSYTYDRKIGLVWNNDKQAFTDKTLNIGQTYTLIAKYVAPNVEVYLDGELIQSLSIGPLIFRPAPQPISISNFSGYNGSVANICWSNLKIYSGGVTLPVNLTDFTANMQNNGVKLEWQTASEENNSHFVVERSTNGKDFSDIITVKSNGNNTNLKTYQAMDHSPENGINYYRLKQIDHDGTKTIFPAIKSVNFTLTAKPALKLYPNPVIGSINIIAEGLNGQYDLIIYNLSGKQIVSDKLVFENGKTSYIIKTPLPKGTYLLTIKDSGFSYKFNIL